MMNVKLNNLFDRTPHMHLINSLNIPFRICRLIELLSKYNAFDIYEMCINKCNAAL